MGQQYLAGALLNHMEGLHVQSFDLPTLLSDSTRVSTKWGAPLHCMRLNIFVQSPEAAIVQLFSEVRRHKPSVIYIPNVDTWYNTVSSTVISTFLGLLRSIPPTDPILLLGVLEDDLKNVDKVMLRDLFGYSKKSQFELTLPRDVSLTTQAAVREIG